MGGKSESEGNSPLRRLERGDEVVLGLGVLHVGRAGIDEFAGDSEECALLLELHPVVCRVCRVLLHLAERGGVGVNHPNGRVVGGDVLDGGILLNPRQHGLASSEERGELRVAGLEVIRVGHEAEGVAAVTTVGRPFFEFLWVERGLCADDRRAPEAGRFARNGVGALRVGEVSVEGEPQRGTRARAAASRADALLVKVPLLRLAADELERASGVGDGPRDGRFHAGPLRLRAVTVVDGDD